MTMTRRPVPSSQSGAFRHEKRAKGNPTSVRGEEEHPDVGTLQQDELCRLVGRNFREARRRANLTQIEVADRIGTHGTYVGTIERGETNITLGMLARLAAVVGVAPGALIADPDPGQQAPVVSAHLVEMLQASIRSLRAIRSSEEASFSTIEAALNVMMKDKHRPG